MVKYIYEDVFPLFGAPRKLLSDGGNSFENIVIKDICPDYGIKYQGVKEFYLLVHLSCYCKMMVFSPSNLDHPYDVLSNF